MQSVTFSTLFGHFDAVTKNSCPFVQFVAALKPRKKEHGEHGKSLGSLNLFRALPWLLREIRAIRGGF
jgi:hypothetical protein